MIGNQCPECDAVLRDNMCRSCGWSGKLERALPQDRDVASQHEQRIATFQACEHVAPGTRYPCEACRREIAELRQRFRQLGEKIVSRIVKL